MRFTKVRFNKLFMKNTSLKSLCLKLIAPVAMAVVVFSCMKDASSVTGWNYNDSKNGGYEKPPFDEQETGPGLVLVEGGTFTMGRTEQDVMFDWNSRAARVTVSSFYMDETEVTNFHWLEYMYWISRAYRDYPQVLKNAMPDTLCWRSPLAFNEKYVDYYLRHPAYRDYPVVGVSWLQANDFCRWRTDRVNEYVLIREGIIQWDTKLKNDSTFNTDSYLNGRFKGLTYLHQEGYQDARLHVGKFRPDTADVSQGAWMGRRQRDTDPTQIQTLNPISAELASAETVIDEQDGRKIMKSLRRDGKIHKGVPNIDPDAKRPNRYVKIEDGILLPAYRLPTEAEWEFAAAGLIGNTIGPETIDERRIYPWDGHWVRDKNAQFQGDFQANFQRGRGDMMGVAGHLNDGADVTAPVTSFWPNDYGLYHMAGNVSEWVLDTYRAMSSEDFDDFRPFRGNVFKTKRYSSEGIVDKNRDENGFGATEYDVHGMKEYLNEFERVRFQRISAATHDPNDPNIGKGTAQQVSARNPYPQGTSPSTIYQARGNKKDEVELDLIKRINEVLDEAIRLKNEGFDIEANRFVRDNIYGPPNLYAEDVFLTDWSNSPSQPQAGGKSLLKQTMNPASGDTIWYGGTRDKRPPLFYEYRAYNYPGSNPDPDSKLLDPSTTVGFYAYGYEVIEMLKEGFSQFITDTPGKLKYRAVTEEENIGRMNYKKSDYRDYLDGDIESSIEYNQPNRLDNINNGLRDPDQVMYQSEDEQYDLKGDDLSPNSSGWPTSLVSNRSKVYKGGSWRDRAYWLAVGNRRFLDEDKSTATIGFRCCMDRIGSPTGNNFTPAKRRRR